MKSRSFCGKYVPKQEIGNERNERNLVGAIHELPLHANKYSRRRPNYLNKRGKDCLRNI